MTIKITRSNVVPMLKRILFRSDMIFYNTNKPLLIVGLGFIGLAVVGSLFIQFIDPNQIQVGLND